MNQSKVRFSCSSCHSKFNAVTDLSGSKTSCPDCGHPLEVPFPGIDRCSFLGLKGLTFVIYIFMLGYDVDLARQFGIPLLLIFSVYLSELRSVNIGHSPWLIGFLGFIPGSIFYFATRRTGAAKLSR